MFSAVTGPADGWLKISTLYYDMVYPVSQALCDAPRQKDRRLQHRNKPACHGHPRRPV